MDNQKIKILAIVGAAGSGKDTITKCIENTNFHMKKILSYTSRPPREGEEDGVNYFFKDKSFFENTNKELCLHRVFNDWHYAVPLETFSYNLVNVLVVDPAGAKDLIEDDDFEVFTLLIHASDKTRLLRQLNREEDPSVEEIIRRYQTDSEDIINFVSWAQNIELDAIRVCVNETSEDLAEVVVYANHLIDNWAKIFHHN